MDCMSWMIHHSSRILNIYLCWLSLRKSKRAYHFGCDSLKKGCFCCVCLHSRKLKCIFNVIYGRKLWPLFSKPRVLLHEIVFTRGFSKGLPIHSYISICVLQYSFTNTRHSWQMHTQTSKSGQNLCIHSKIAEFFTSPISSVVGQRSVQTAHPKVMGFIPSRLPVN